jgi:hypothetical protein
VVDEAFERFANRLAERVRDQVADKVLELLENSGLLGSPATESSATAPPSRVAPASGGRTPSGMKVCSHEGCNLPARARGLCSKHYQRQRYAEKKTQGADADESGSTGSRQNPRPTAKRGGGLCKQEGCDEPNYAKGLCSKHFMEWVRTKKSKTQTD